MALAAWLPCSAAAEEEGMERAPFGFSLRSGIVQKCVVVVVVVVVLVVVVVDVAGVVPAASGRWCNSSVQGLGFPVFFCALSYRALRATRAPKLAQRSCGRSAPGRLGTSSYHPRKSATNVRPPFPSLQLQTAAAPQIMRDNDDE